MKDKIFYLFPFIYFLKTRVPSLKSFAFHLYNEWMPAVVFILLVPHSPLFALVNFAIYYLAFISFYELGYILNDHYSVKYEDSPRMRSKALSKEMVLLMAFIRIAVFSGIVIFNQLYLRTDFILFYILLGLVFFAHNFIRNKEYKIITFINLATFRYLAPFVFLIEMDFLILIFPSILLNYVFYRTFSYMESKSLLNLPGRKDAGFKLSYYSFLIPISFIISIFYKDYLPVYINLYYLFFWIIFWILGKQSNKNLQS